MFIQDDACFPLHKNLNNVKTWNFALLQNSKHFESPNTHKKLFIVSVLKDCVLRQRKTRMHKKIKDCTCTLSYKNIMHYLFYLSECICMYIWILPRSTLERSQKCFKIFYKKIHLSCLFLRSKTPISSITAVLLCHE